MELSNRSEIGLAVCAVKPSLSKNRAILDAGMLLGDVAIKD
jgi:hypothetical protein